MTLGSLEVKVLIQAQDFEPLQVGAFQVDLKAQGEAPAQGEFKVHLDKDMIVAGLRALADSLDQNPEEPAE